MAADTLNAVRGCGFHCRSLTPSQDLRFLLAVRESPVFGTPRRFAALLKFGSYRSESGRSEHRGARPMAVACKEKRCTRPRKVRAINLQAAYKSTVFHTDNDLT